MGCLKLSYYENRSQLKVVPGESETDAKSCAGLYRFGFNGMETDDEIKGSKNSLDFGARIYDPRLGRWLSVDPLQKKYPSFTPYSFSNNTAVLTPIPGTPGILSTLSPARA